MNPVSARNIRFVGHSDMNGKGDGVQVMVHRGYAYVGHGFSNGITTLDVRDAKHPKVTDFIACPQGTRAFHLQTNQVAALLDFRAVGIDESANFPLGPNAYPGAENFGMTLKLRRPSADLVRPPFRIEMKVFGQT